MEGKRGTGFTEGACARPPSDCSSDPTADKNGGLTIMTIEPINLIDKFSETKFPNFSQNLIKFNKLMETVVRDERLSGYMRTLIDDIRDLID